MQPSEEVSSLLQECLAHLLGRVQLGAGVKVRLNMKVGWLQKLAQDGGCGGTVELGGLRRQLGRGPPVSPNGAFPGVYSQSHLLGCGGSSGEGVGHVLGFY